MKDHAAPSVEYGAGFVITKATKCGADGEEIVKCDTCGKEFKRAIPGHNYDDGIVVEKATCTTKGIRKLTCKDCNSTKTEEIEVLGHDLSAPVELVPAKCGVTGKAIKVCNRAGCGYKEETNLRALEHTKPDDFNPETARVWLDEKGKKVTEAQALDAGKTLNTCYYTEAREYTCKNKGSNKCTAKDGLVREIVKKATGHAIDSTFKEGIATIDTNKIKDPITGKYDYDIVDKYVKDTNGIVFEKNAKVDCRHEKIKIFTCKYCGEEDVTVVVEARKAHSGNVETHIATCEEDGYTLTSCTSCNEVIKEYTSSKQLGHNYTYYAPDACTTNPTIKCSRCPSILDSEEVAKLYKKDEKLTDTQKAWKKSIDASCSNAKVPGNATDGWNIPKADGHNFVGTVTINGKTGKARCNHCNHSIDVNYDKDTNTITVKSTSTTRPEEITATGTWKLDSNKTILEKVSDSQGGTVTPPQNPDDNKTCSDGHTLSGTVTMDVGALTGKITCSECNEKISITLEVNNDNNTIGTITDSDNKITKSVAIEYEDDGTTIKTVTITD